MTAYNEFEIDGQKYRATNLDTFTQLHVARRLAPLLTPLLPAITAALTVERKPGEQGLKELAPQAMQPVIDALGKMPEDDLNYILKACLAVVQRHSGPGWQRVQAAGGGLMFDDINLIVMLNIVWQVIQGDVATFFREIPPPTSGEAGA